MAMRADCFTGGGALRLHVRAPSTGIARLLVLERSSGDRQAARRRRAFLLLPLERPAWFLAVPNLEVELVDIVLRESERIPQHDHVLLCERLSVFVKLCLQRPG
jgi:hypothetical protein